MLKCTNFFKLDPQGFSETYFSTQANLNTALTALRRMAGFRLAMCPSTVSYIGTRVADLDNPAQVLGARESAVGTYSGARDLTNAAILWKGFAAGNIKRQIWTKGAPDEIIVNGVYTPTSTFAVAAANWATDLVNTGWCVRTQNRTANPIVDGSGIGNTGILTTFGTQTWVEGDSLKFFRSRDTNGVTIKGIYRIGPPIDNKHFQLIGWMGGRVATVVRMRRYVLVTSALTTIFINKAGTRKSGRPFGQAPGVARRAG